MSNLNLDYSNIIPILEQYQNLEVNTEKNINNVVHGYGAELIQTNITNILPVSGRTWNGKKRGAKSGKPFRNIKENLGIVVKSKTNYNYLYFPDDGSNTQKHAGNQKFMQRGAEASIDNIKNKIIEQIINELE